MMQKLLAEMGRLDVLVNNAGITRDRSLRKMGPEDWAAVMHTNLDSVFNMSKQALEPMLEQRWGRIINISSVNAQQGAFGQANYAAAKAGMHGFTKALALETARHGITVNTVSPGYLRTKMVMQVPDDILQSKILPQIPVGRLGEPDEVAALVAYLVVARGGLRDRRQHRHQRRPAHELGGWLALLGARLAADAQLRFGARLQAREADRVAAFLAFAVAAVVELGERAFQHQHLGRVVAGRFQRQVVEQAHGGLVGWRRFHLFDREVVHAGVLGIALRGEFSAALLEHGFQERKLLLL